MSPSSVSDDSGAGERDQDVSLIEDGPDNVSVDRASYRARHAQSGSDDDKPNKPDASGPGDATAVGPPVATANTAVVDALANVPPELDLPVEWEGHTQWEPWEEPEDFRFIVRPYTWTKGRTTPVQDLAVETLVSTSDVGLDVSTAHSAEHSAIAGLCADVRSVAEVAALLALPLGVARVLLADMIDTGLVHVHRSPTELGGPPGLSLMERVLAGLQEL